MWTGIPPTKLLASDRDRLLHLEDVLAERVVGQVRIRILLLLLQLFLLLLLLPPWSLSRLVSDHVLLLCSL
jgi:hypothetical protein